MKYGPEMIERRARAYAWQPPRPGDAVKVDENATEWRSRDLVKVVAAVCAAMGVSCRRHVEFHYRRDKTRRLGFASIGARWMRINLPRPDPRTCPEVVAGELRLCGTALQEVAETIAHEVEHNLGLSHREMPNGCRVPNAYPRAQAAARELSVRTRRGFVIPTAPAPVDPATAEARRLETLDAARVKAQAARAVKAAKREERIRAAVGAWEARVVEADREAKRARRMLAATRTKLRAIERRAAKKAARSGGAA
jgi:hypothetical protein